MPEDPELVPGWHEESQLKSDWPMDPELNRSVTTPWLLFHPYRWGTLTLETSWFLSEGLTRPDSSLDGPLLEASSLAGTGVVSTLSPDPAFPCAFVGL